MALTVAISLVVRRSDAQVSQVNLYADQHHISGGCGEGHERIVIYRSSFEPEEGYGRGWQVGGLNPTWLVLPDGYDGIGWAAHGSSISDQHLISPPIDLPFNADQIRLRFYTEPWIEPAKANCYDGGLLETSADGGASWSQVTDDDLLTDLYDGTILPSSGNPLAGRQAWCRYQAGWWDSIVDLDEYAGQTVIVRFRFGTDSSNNSVWKVDKVRVEACLYPVVYLPLVFK
jgi:hypothetical protein